MQEKDNSTFNLIINKENVQFVCWIYFLSLPIHKNVKWKKKEISLLT